MKTKLVYVLTCESDKHYIEQALMSVFSARHWNPEVHIVLMVDDLTDKLLAGTRAEVLDYVSEKIVVPFEDSSLSMMYRSRFIKTSVRQRIDGDFLFVDCDTLVCRSLEEIDGFEAEIGAVPESHLPVKEFCGSLHRKAVEDNRKLGVDLDAEGFYFSSGVLFVKDTPQTRQFYQVWHRYWLESCEAGLPIDQPSLARANRDGGHLISRIPDTYNCILFTRNTFVDQAHILHIAAFRNPSYLFTDKVFSRVESCGLEPWIREAVLNPTGTMLPFDYRVRHSTPGERVRWIRTIAGTASVIRKNLPELMDGFPMKSSLRGMVSWLFRHRCYQGGALLWMTWKRVQVLRKPGLKDNVCKA